MFFTILFLAIAAIIGVIAATTTTCLIGLLTGTSTWCGFIYVWPIGIVLAVPIAIILSYPIHLIFKKLNFQKWWQFAIGGLILALPIWAILAQPFTSARWQSSGFFDSLNYLGSGIAAGLIYWRFKVFIFKHWF